MITLFERATVPDFDTWHKVFKDFAPTLKAKGVTGSSVYQSTDNPNDVTVVHEFRTLDEAKAFIDSSELHAARARAAVADVPTIWFTEEV
jgi:heme-degrading monooxygenase HmoA